MGCRIVRRGGSSDFLCGYIIWHLEDVCAFGCFVRIRRGSSSKGNCVCLPRRAVSVWAVVVFVRSLKRGILISGKGGSWNPFCSEMNTLAVGTTPCAFGWFVRIRWGYFGFIHQGPLCLFVQESHFGLVVVVFVWLKKRNSNFPEGWQLERALFRDGISGCGRCSDESFHQNGFVSLCVVWEFCGRFHFTRLWHNICDFWSMVRLMNDWTWMVSCFFSERDECGHKVQTCMWRVNPMGVWAFFSPMLTVFCKE